MSQKKVLVVDDDPSIVKIVESILTAQGHEVIKASDGEAALQQVKAHSPKLLILDIMMPGMNGYDVCRTLKFDSPYKDMPILLLTSRDQEIDPRIGQMMGIEYYQKPVNREAFLAKVGQILK